jgi:hypothetical protein
LSVVAGWKTTDNRQPATVERRSGAGRLELKGASKIVDAHVYPAEGHGFAKRENQIDAIKRTIEWFDRYLKPARPAASAAQRSAN